MNKAKVHVKRGRKLPKKLKAPKFIKIRKKVKIRSKKGKKGKKGKKITKFVTVEKKLTKVERYAWHLKQKELDKEGSKRWVREREHWRECRELQREANRIAWEHEQKQKAAQGCCVIQ